MSTPQQITLSQIFSAFSRHRYKAFIAWTAVMSMVFVAFILMPKKYGSEGRLYVQLGRNNSPISPTTGSASISIQDTRETEIRSVVEIILSRAVLEKVVDDIGAQKILESPWDGWMPSIGLPEFSEQISNEMSKDEFERYRQRELAAKALSESLHVDAEKKTSVISIFVKAQSPKLAQKIVNKIVEHTKTVHLKVHASESSATFFDDQFEAQQKALVEAETKLAEFRNARNVLSIGAERDTLQNIFSQLEIESVMEEVNLAKSKEALKKIQGLMATTEAQIAVPKSGVERLSYEDSRTTLFNLEAERERLVALYTPTHPDVQRIDQQLKKVRNTLDSMATDRTESQMEPNPVYESVKIDLQHAETDFAATQARWEMLKLQRDKCIGKIKDLNSALIASDQLERDVEVARQYLGNYTQKRGESMAMSGLDDREISDLSIAQEATLGLKHVSPRGSIVLPMGFIAGLIAALATVLFYERNNLSPSLSESEIEQIIGLPVLVSLPRVYSSRNMVN